MSQVGLTIWKVRPANADAFSGRHISPGQWIAERVEADRRFHAGDYLRLSIECPRAGYLYVIDRELYADGTLGQAQLIFPILGDNNRLRAGRLIDVPGENRAPFQASPQANQAGEVLTFLILSAPLKLTLSKDPVPIPNAQLRAWEQLWGSATERFEMEGGAGQLRTVEEQRAASRMRTRQLTREDPAPQTIYLVSASNRDALLFTVKLSYAR